MPDGIECIAADLADAEAAAALVQATAPSHILHAAWETRQPSYWNDPVNIEWVVATAAMAAAFARSGGQRFVQVGSCAEYDWTSEPPLRDGPATRYGKAKLAAFRAVEVAGHDAFSAAEARIFWVYGPGENPARFIPLLCRSYAGGVTPTLGSGEQVRDLVFINDAAQALLLLLETDRVTGVVDIGTGAGTKLADVARHLAGLAGASETGLRRIPDRPGDPELLVANGVTLASIGWMPTTSVSDGLGHVFAACRDGFGKSA